MKINKNIQTLAIASLLTIPSYAGSTSHAKGAQDRPEKGAPLPLHTIEGTGGVLITPLAYLVNPGPEGTKLALPSVSTTYVNAHQKNVTSLSVTESAFGRVEFGFGASKFGTGTLGTDVLDATGVDIGRDNVWLYNTNVKVLALKENSYGAPLPAVSFGVHGKFNDGINDIDSKLGGALKSIGYHRDYGVDFTLTATKSFDVGGHPLIISLGGRASQAAQLGYLGFSDDYKFTFEGNIVFGVTDRVFLAFEYRQKPNPYGKINGLIGKENDWWTIGTAFILDKHTTLTVGYGHFGQVLNTKENAAWATSLKYEF